MNEPETDDWEDVLAGHLADLDEQLRTGQPGGPASWSAAETPQQEVRQRAESCVHRLRRLWLLVDPATGQVVRELPFPSYHDEWQEVTGRAESTNIMAFSPEGRWLAVGPRSGHLHTWDLAMEHPSPTSWRAYPQDVDRLLFTSGDGNLLSLDRANTLKSWASQPRWHPRPVPIPAGIGAGCPAALRRVGLLVFQQANRMILAEAKDLSPVFSWPSADHLLAAAPDGRSLLVAGSATLGLHATDTGAMVAILPTSNVSNRATPCFSPDGCLLAQADSTTRQLKLWDLAANRLAVTAIVPRSLGRTAIDPTGQWLAVPAEDRTYLYELRRTPVQEVIGLETNLLRSIAFSREGDAPVLPVPMADPPGTAPGSDFRGRHR